MYTDEVEDSLTDELIDIMMQDQSSTEEVKLMTIAPQLAPVNEVFRKTPSPRSSPCPSPTMFMATNNGYTEGMNYIKPHALSPMHGHYGTKHHMRNHIQQPEQLTPKHDISTDATSFSGNNASGISIKIEQEGSKDLEKVESINIEDSKEIKMGGRTKKSGSSTLSSLEATSFQKRLFGLNHSTAHNRKSHTLPSSSKATSDKKTSDLRLFTEPPLSPASITNSPHPPPEPMELQYFEVTYIKSA